MSTQISTVANTQLGGIRGEAVGSTSVNRRLVGVPRGIVRGFRPVPDAANQTLQLEIDPLHQDSVINLMPSDPGVSAGPYSITYRETADITLDLSADASSTIYVGVRHNYTTTASTTVDWRSYSQAEIDDGTADEAVIVCSVDVPATAIPLVAADIDESERDESWMWVSARGASDVPLVTPSYDDEFTYWTFQSLAASSTLAMTATDQKRGNASILLDVNDAGAVTNQFGPGEVVNVVPAQVLFVKFWYRTSASVNFSTNPTFVAEFFAAGSSLGTQSISISTSPTTTFTLVEDQIIVPASSRQATFYFDVQTNGVTDFYVDGLQVYARRLDSDAGGWLDQNEKLIGRNVGASAVFIRHEEDDSAETPFKWTRPSSTQLALSRDVGTVLAAVVIGDTTTPLLVGINTNSPNAPLNVEKETVANNTVSQVILADHTTSDGGNGAAGIGASIALRVENANGAVREMGTIEAVADVTTHLSEDSHFGFAVRSGGSLPEKMRLTKTGLGLSLGASDAVDTKLHLADTTADSNTIRLELNNTTIADGNVYGKVEWEGQDSQQAGVRGSIRGQAEDTAGGMSIVFATAADNIASPPTDRAKITNLGFMVLGDDFTVFDTTDNTDYGFDIGSDSLRFLAQSDNQNNANVVALYNSNTGAKDSQNEIRFYREDSGQSPTLNRMGSLRFLHEGVVSDYLGQFDLLLNADGGATTVSSVLNITGSDGYATFGSGEGSTSATATGLRLARSAGVANTSTDLTLTFDNLNTATTASLFPIGAIDFHGNASGNEGVNARIFATGLGSTGAGILNLQTGTAGSLATALVLSTSGDGGFPSGGVLIGTGAAITTSVGLEIRSTTRALLLPRMTTTERDALTAAPGMLIFNTTTNTVQFTNNSSAWATV